MKNILRNRLNILTLVIVSLICQHALNAKVLVHDNTDSIQIIYPKDSQIVRAVDSTFILGNLSPQIMNSKSNLCKLIINSKEIFVHKDGGFLGFVPVLPGEFTFTIQALLYGKNNQIVTDALNKEITVQIPEPLTPVPFDSLKIVKEIDAPSGDLNLKTGDRLQVTFQGTPGCIASFTIPGVAENIKMAETSPRTQPYWGESVFGVGAVPDSLLLKGIYTGFYDIPASIKVDDTPIQFSLIYPRLDSVRAHLLDSANTSVMTVHQIEEKQNDTAKLSSSYKISINSDEFPFTVQFTDSIQTIRHGARKGYFSIFQPKGVEALVTSSEGDWYIAELTNNHKAYIYKNSVEKLPQGILPPHSYLSVIRCKGSDDNVKIEFPLSGKHPFKITEVDKRTLKVQLYGVTTDTDWIRYDFSDKLIDIATWEQPEEELYEFTIKLTKDLWGYDTYYEGNTFYLQINKAPQKVKELKGKTIVIDPGHSSDKGSVGPTGYTEAEANLGISLVLQKMLEDKGANVVMTRIDDSHVELYDRPVIANAVDADLFISMHNNALPDGVNPYTHNGSSTYYYHPHSISLAKHIQSELPKATGLNDYGLYHGNLAVNRPTQYPAVLVETAFMIIPEQEALLKTEKFRKKVSKAIIKGIENFLKEYDHDNRK